ncbi:hypothetical protein ACFX15_044578 [Malus domestica]
MYGKCGDLFGASRVLDEMVVRDAVSWNAIIAAYGQNEIEKETLSFFVSMLRSRMEPDEFTFGSVLKACAGRLSLNYGMEIHSRIIKSGMGMNLFVGGALVDVYCKCGMMEEAEKIHDRTEEQIMVSWNAIISGFSLLKQNEEAQRFLPLMLEMGAEPDNFTYATVLDTSANLATVGLGRQIHAQIIKHELQSDVYITSTTIVDMYSKCGNMQDSHLMFKKAPKRDAVTWNAMTLLEFLSTCSLRTWSQTMQLLFQSSELVDILGTLKKVYTTSAQCLAPTVYILSWSITHAWWIL